MGNINKKFLFDSDIKFPDFREAVGENLFFCLNNTKQKTLLHYFQKIYNNILEENDDIKNKKNILKEYYKNKKKFKCDEKYSLINEEINYEEEAKIYFEKKNILYYQKYLLQKIYINKFKFSNNVRESLVEYIDIDKFLKNEDIKLRLGLKIITIPLTQDLAEEILKFIDNYKNRKIIDL